VLDEHQQERLIAAPLQAYFSFDQIKSCFSYFDLEPLCDVRGREKNILARAVAAAFVIQLDTRTKHFFPDEKENKRKCVEHTKTFFKNK
jgi:hypothetical protein